MFSSARPMYLRTATSTRRQSRPRRSYGGRSAVERARLAPSGLSRSTMALDAAAFTFRPSPRSGLRQSGAARSSMRAQASGRRLHRAERLHAAGSCATYRRPGRTWWCCSTRRAGAGLPGRFDLGEHVALEPMLSGSAAASITQTAFTSSTRFTLRGHAGRFW